MDDGQTPPRKDPKPRAWKRRELLRNAAATAAAIALPTIITTPLRGAAAPSNRITIAAIGLGGMGRHHLRAFAVEPTCEVVALCDVNDGQTALALPLTNLSREDCYRDFREILERPDIDAVDISTPDHWHTPMAIAAMKAGKAVYLQKPVSLTIAEGRTLVEARRRYSGILQTGSQQRSERNFRLAAQIVRNHRLGSLKKIEVGLEKPYYPYPGLMAPTAPPADLDYDRWLGPAPWRPYTSERVIHFRSSFDYSGGYFSDWGAHHLDIVQWALDKDDSGPAHADGWGEFWTEGIFDVPHDFHVVFRYEEGTEVHASLKYPNGIRFVGERGELFVSREKFTATPQSLITEPFGPGSVLLPESRGHDRDFLDAVRAGRQPIVPAEIGHRSATMCHIGNLSMRLGRPLTWDPKREHFVGDDEANRMRSVTARAPWGVIA